MPGGYGTLDEAFEIITLVQTGKLDRLPIVGMGGSFWKDLRKFSRGTMLREGTISPEDLELIQPAENAQEALRLIEDR